MPLRFQFFGEILGILVDCKGLSDGAVTEWGHEPPIHTFHLSGFIEEIRIGDVGVRRQLEIYQWMNMDQWV